MVLIHRSESFGPLDHIQFPVLTNCHAIAEHNDFGSILNFIEKTFNLPSLGYADARADDLSDCFDFQQNPLTFQPVSSRYDAKPTIVRLPQTLMTTSSVGFDQAREMFLREPQIST